MKELTFMKSYISIDKKRKNGAVYTPKNLAVFVADKLIDYYVKSVCNKITAQKNPLKSNNTIKNLKILDPACGDGELLIAVWNSLLSTFTRLGINKSRVIFNPLNTLFGIDIDKEAVKTAKNRIKTSLNISRNSNQIKILRSNALFAFNREKGQSLLEGFSKDFTGLIALILS